jgi:nucleoside-diphosphate-sugar epimerase
LNYPHGSHTRPIDALVHCAYDFSSVKPEESERLNVEGSIQLFQAAHKAGVRKLIFVSSLSAYNDCPTIYGRGKLRVESVVLEMGGLVIRPGTVWGPHPGGMMGDILAQCKNQRLVLVIWHPRGIYLTYEQDLFALIDQYLAGQLALPDQPVFAAGTRAWLLSEIVKATAGTKMVICLPIPWFVLWAGISTAEKLRLKLRFRSDSALSAGNPIPPSQVALLATPPWPFREFDPRILYEK